ncbi:hypothetical protein ACVW1A_002755 [Bradyrhizobium sp. LB1.3]
MAVWLSESSIEERMLAEREQIARVRAAHGLSQTDPSRLVGLALSSGGLRSATFCLGVLQGLAAAGLLRGIDYLSCVGGGGYIGGRISAMIARDGFEHVNDALPRERISLPNAPYRLIFLSSVIDYLSPLLFLLAGTAALIPLLAKIVPLDWSLPQLVPELAKLITPVTAPIVLGAAAILGLKQLFPTRRAISHFVGKRYLNGDIPLGQLANGGPYPLFGAVVGERKPIALSPIDRFSTAEAITASGPPPDAPVANRGLLAGLSRLLVRERVPISRLHPGSLFDSLGIYELVRRRCEFVIACDGTSDADLTFDALGRVIRKCRLDLGVEIEFSFGPLSQKKQVRRHYQMGTIRYPDGKAGFLLLFKPAVTGEEPTDVLQFASAHPTFPMLDVRPGSFDEDEHECYRRLGEYAVGSLVREVPDSSEWPRVPFEEVLRSIRQVLRPDLKNVEPLRAPEAIPVGLIDAIASGECVLYAGAGLGAQAGLPTWPELLRGLLSYARERSRIDPAVAKELDAAIEAGDLEEVGDDLSHRIPREDIAEYLRTTFEASTQPSHAHELLAELPFVGALNTGLDNLLAKAFSTAALLPADTAQLVSVLQSKARFALNVSGLPALPDSVVLNSRQFRTGVSENPQFKQFLGTLFLQYHTLFVGSNVDGIRGFLDALGLSGPPARRQYALIPREGQLDPVEVRYLDRTYNMHIVEYEPGFNYSGFVEYLEKATDAIRPKPTPSRATAGNMTLKSVALENIGPFETLRLDLTPGWNLLLGDNGKGKTVILKAIAAALCGEAADPALLERLLRSGADRGTIRLEVESREHTMELTRIRGGKVKARYIGLSPLESDRWLAIGFPALRSIPWENPAGPDKSPETIAEPGPDDLLPLLQGAPDGRIANLKQWLVNLDYAGQQEVIEEFFDVFGALSPGIRIGRPRIEKNPLGIWIESNGSVVPLSAVSQGAGSVMCWIGNLIQRMHEVNISADSRPLVLVDEVDAHMHPKWQQLFIEAFRKKFPSVQVVATTHSPLMVGSLTKDEIWIIRSVPVQSEIYGVAHVKQMDGATEITVTGPAPVDDDDPPREERRYKVPADVNLRISDGEIVEMGEALTLQDVKIAAERIDIPPEGWRVDQILMLPYFGLERTRDARTAELIDRFTRLAAKSDPDAKELETVAAELKMRAPAPHESKAAREAFELIREFAENRLQKLPSEEKERVLVEAKAQLTESITGSRRPI